MKEIEKKILFEFSGTHKKKKKKRRRKVKIWIWSVNKSQKHFGNSAGAVPYSSLCNDHEGVRNKNSHRQKKLGHII